MYVNRGVHTYHSLRAMVRIRLMIRIGIRIRVRIDQQTLETIICIFNRIRYAILLPYQCAFSYTLCTTGTP